MTASIGFSAILLGVSGAENLSELEYDFLFDAASPGRKRRAEKFVRREDACRTLLAEALIRYAVKISGGVTISEPCFTTNEHGKPSIFGLGIQFNVAHSGDWVICAADTNEVGADIERHHTVNYDIAERFFSQPEIDALSTLPAGAERSAMFFKIWSLKESYIKAIGKGLSCPLATFACLPSIADDTIVFHRFDETLPHMEFDAIDIDRGYSCAVCRRRRENAITPIIISPARLIAEL